MIGIVGGKGEIGLECVNLLNDYEREPIKIGIRNSNAIVDEKNKLYEFIDIKNRKSCFEFAKDCDCIINCTNVRGSDIYNLIDAAGKYKAKFVDVNYHNSQEKIEIYNTTIYHGVGASPGLTEVLPKIIANKFEQITELKLYYTTVGRFTFSAAKEYLRYIESGEVYSATVLKNGDIIPCANDRPVISLPIGNEKWNTLPYIDERTVGICKQLNLENAGFYMCIQDGYTYEFLKNIWLKYKDDKDKTAQELVKASEIDCLHQETYSGFVLEAEGIIDQCKCNMNLIMKSPSASKLTALAVTATALLSLDSKEEFCVLDMSAVPFVDLLLDKMSEVDPLFFHKIYKNKTLSSINTFEGEI